MKRDGHNQVNNSAVVEEAGLMKRVGRGQYSISDPLFAEYVKRQKPE